ncbi:uncharacterized protein LOC111988816 [Quercus suber]|uniref:uncharacterized protein LOC111988816 n=1 Tax=Quercus suber TaxID=58331 RepID=UPI000CE1D2CD|nr:uncharacterized protein LOC111988816 [Quercus suber]
MSIIFSTWSVHTTHIDQSHPRGGSHVSHAKKDKNMQLKIDQLKRKLRHAKRKRTSSYFDDNSSNEPDVTYKRRSRIPVSESFSYEEEHYCKRQPRSSLHGGVGNYAMSKALNQISRSPFTHRIEDAILPRRFHQPTFTIYNGKTDPVEHVSHFNQMMAVHFKDETLMCKVFPSSLGPVAMRWFDSLKANSISSFKELTQVFGSCFVTCRRVARPLASLLSFSMQEGETLKMYSDRYWKMFNEMEGDFDEVALNTFKLGLPADHGLRKSLTEKPVTSVRQLIDRIDKYKRVEEDQQQGKRKDKVIL